MKKSVNSPESPRIGIMVEFFDPTISGVVTAVYTMARDFLKSCFGVPVVFAPRVAHKDKAPFQVVRVPSIPLGLKAAIAFPFIWPGLLRKIKKLDLSLIHLQSAYTLGLLGVRLKTALGIPLIVHFHTDIVATSSCFLGRLEPLLGKIVRSAALFLFKCLSDNADRIIVPSLFTKKALIKYGIDPLKISVIPTPVEAPKKLIKKPEARKKLRLPLEKLLLLFVGRMSADKNLEMLLQSFKIISISRPDAVLVLVGGGLYAWKLRYLIWRMGLSGKVILAGPIPYEDIYDWYLACDIFTFSGADESQGLTPLEALAVGLPVVAIGSGGVVEYVGDYGSLVGNDPKQFAEATLALASDPALCRELGERGATYIRHSMSAEVIYRPLYVLYREVLSN